MKNAGLSRLALPAVTRMLARLNNAGSRVPTGPRPTTTTSITLDISRYPNAAEVHVSGREEVSANADCALERVAEREKMR